jgi:hypothetical protein
MKRLIVKNNKFPFDGTNESAKVIKRKQIEAIKI